MLLPESRAVWKSLGRWSVRHRILVRDSFFAKAETRRQLEDGSAGLLGPHPASRERATVAYALDLEADRFAVSADILS